MEVSLIVTRGPLHVPNFTFIGAEVYDYSTQNSQNLVVFFNFNILTLT